MAFLNNILSSWKGKRLNSDAFPDHDRYMKKQRHATNGPAQVGLPSRVDSETKETRCKVNKMIMLYVQNQSHVEAPGADGGPPKAQLTQNIFATVLIDNVMDSLHGHARHEQQLWSLGAFLFSDPQMDRQITQSIASPQQRRLKNWIRATVVEEMDLLGGGPMLGAAAADDGWARCFHYMSTGKVVQAAELAQKLGDDALMAMLVIHYQQDDTPLDIHKAAEEQIDYWRAENAFDAFHLDRKRMWYVLQGKLGYVDELKMVITHDLAWPQALLLYALYGDRYGHLPSALARYEALVRDQHVLNPHTLRAKKETQPVPQHCQWYRLLLWWAIAITPDAFSQQETAIQPAIETSFPLRFRWLLMLHVNNMLKHPNKDNWTADWCDQLFNDGMEYMAMHAALYMTNSEPWIKDKLSKRTWDKEHYLIRQLQIPAAWIIEAKAVYAHNQGQFDDEIRYYEQLNDEAQLSRAILRLVPRLFFEKTQAAKMDACLSKLRHLTTDPQRQQLVDAIAAAHNTFTIHANDTAPETWKTTIESLLRVLLDTQNAPWIDDAFIADMAQQLFQRASMALDEVTFQQLVETSSRQWYGQAPMNQVLSPFLYANIVRSTP